MIQELILSGLKSRLWIESIRHYHDFVFIEKSFVGPLFNLSNDTFEIMGEIMMYSFFKKVLNPLKSAF
jgi:hypothetical protein